MSSLGEDLKKQREQRKMSLDEIAQQTKVGLRHLRALETDRFDQLPGGIFNRGILRSYLKALDLEEEPWLERFLKESGELGTGVGNEHDSEPWLRYAETVTGTKAGPPGEEDVRYRWLGVVVLFAALVGLAWALWKFAWQHWHS